MLQTTFLWYLVQIEHYQSLSLAAEQLHVSQPALSKGIKTLEEQLGVKLISRTYKGVTLTEEGKHVSALAKPIFDSLNQIETMFLEQIPDEKQFFLDDIILYTNPAYTAHLMSMLSKQYSQSTALNALQIFNTPAESDINKLVAKSNNTVVLAILPENYSISENISITVLNKSKAYVMCTPEFAYITPTQNSISFKELLSIPCGIVKTSFDFQSTLLHMLAQYGEPTIKVVAPDPTSLTAAVKSGTICSFSNKFFYTTELEELRYLPIRNAPVFQLCLIYGKHTSQAVISQLIDLLKPFIL